MKPIRWSTFIVGAFLIAFGFAVLADESSIRTIAASSFVIMGVGIMVR